MAHGGALHYSYSTLRGALYLGLERLLKGRTDGAIFESEFTLRSYARSVGAAEFPHRVVHNGLYEHEFARVERGDEYDFVFVGELRNLKGIYVLVDAAHQVRQQREFKLLAVGAGDEQASLESRIRELGLDDIVHVCPPIHPVTEALARGRCIVIPSLAESLPYVVLETAAAAVPLLTTNVGGIPEIFGPFADRLLPPGDARALAGAMLEFLENPEHAESISEAICERVRSRFRVSQMVDAISEFYSGILHRDKQATKSIPADR
jgi:glycosyltransferase involved in cell wall biosynthesis